jgi:hypothetical protein
MIFEPNALGSGQLPTEQITVQFIRNKKNLLRTFLKMGSKTCNLFSVNILSAGRANEEISRVHP